MGGGEEHRDVWIRSTQWEGKMKKNGVRAVRIHGPTLFAECTPKNTWQMFFIFYFLRV